MSANLTSEIFFSAWKYIICDWFNKAPLCTLKLQSDEKNNTFHSILKVDIRHRLAWRQAWKLSPCLPITLALKTRRLSLFFCGQTRISDSKTGKTQLKPGSALGLEAAFRGGATRAIGVRITLVITHSRLPVWHNHWYFNLPCPNWAHWGRTQERRKKLQRCWLWAEENNIGTFKLQTEELSVTSRFKL